MNAQAKEKRGNGAARDERDRTEIKTLRKRIKELEARVVKFEREIEGIDMKLADTALHADKPAEAAALAKTRAAAAVALAEAEEEWLAASARNEELSGQA
jgi:ATP-binding cassette, subfamily F, member 3